MGGEESNLASQGDDVDEPEKSHEALAVSAVSARKWRHARNWSLFWLVFVAAVSLIGLIFAWRGNPANNTLRFELAKTFMQVLAVAFLGGLVTLATFTYQDSRAQENEQTRRAEEKAEEKAEAAIRRAEEKAEGAIRRAEEGKERKEERDRRDFENARAERIRQDNQLRLIVEETLRAYNRAKRIRRLLEAETNDRASGFLTLAVYDRHMTDLIDEQLAFERLKRSTPFISDERLGQLPAFDTRQPQAETKTRTLTKSSLVQRYDDIETYLNHVVSEYQDKRYTLKDKAGVALTEFEELRGFIDGEFIARVSDKMDDVIETLLEALWQPLNSPPGNLVPRGHFPVNRLRSKYCTWGL